MTLQGDVVGIVPGVMSEGLLGRNLRWLDKPKKGKKLPKLAVDNIVGIGLIGATASAANRID